MVHDHGAGPAGRLGGVHRQRGARGRSHSQSRQGHHRGVHRHWVQLYRQWSQQGDGVSYPRYINKRKGEQQSAAAIVNRLRGPLSQLTEVQAFPFLPPAIAGVSSLGGFTFEVQDEGGNTVQQLYTVAQKLVQEGNSRRDLSGLFSPFTANDPQFVVKIDREKARSLQIPIQQVSDALQVYMGSAYVNDFDFNNRAYRVYVQADQPFRRQPRDIRNLYVRSDSGAMIPLDNVVSITEGTAPQVITHYNLFRSAEIDGAAAPGYSSGQAIAAMDAVAKKDLPLGFNYSWSGLSLEEIKSGGQSATLFGLGLLLVYLTLSAQYESFVLPFIILLSVPMAMLGALIAQSAARAVERRVLPDRPGDADRPVQQERNSYCRVRRTVAR